MSQLVPLLRNVPLFLDLTDEELERIASIAIPRSYPKKSLIFAEGSPREAVYFIVDGLVKAFKVDANGHEQIVSLLAKGDMFPHTGFFDQSPYPANAEAVKPTRVFAIPIQSFEQLLLSTPTIAVKVLRVLGAKIRELQEKLQELTYQDVRHRICAILLRLAETHGTTQDGTVVLRLPVTHQDLASMAGTTRESVNRMLNDLRRQRILEMNRNHIVLKDVEALKSWADEWRKKR
ncbi:transcriptional regulator [Planifilum fimeticola]|uniref:Transcriptional regulator n=1 Tax=Planifilum fimeticola TaxID=201975 RepID=A0A2T0LGR1_9BACL|nr:Crp/Fnr family transcriptional regulator [Planifilum fimeticola]PRX41489.1 transcriptional regulator [Planifilum fimeticola]